MDRSLIEMSKYWFILFWLYLLVEKRVSNFNYISVLSVKKKKKDFSNKIECERNK